MLHPSYSDLMKIVNEGSEGDTPVVNSRYSIVMAAAKRARQIIADENADPDDRAKPLSAAVRELSEGEIRIIPQDNIEEDEIIDLTSDIDKIAMGLAAEESDDDEEDSEKDSDDDSEEDDEEDEEDE